MSGNRLTFWVSNVLLVGIVAFLFWLTGSPTEVQTVGAASANTLQVDTFTSSTSWTAPTGVTSVNVEAWGGGGGGGGNGGGGAYVSSTVAVTAGTTYNVVVGSGGLAGFSGGTSTFATTTVLAAPGWSGTTFGSGGQAASSTGDTKYSGGNATSSAGGGGAGDSGGGFSGIAGPTNGGIGRGNSAGKVPGGGGGNATRAGARGEVRITYLTTATAGFPVVEKRSWGRDIANTTVRSLTLPTGINTGDLLLAVVGSDGNPDITITNNGWIKLGQASSSQISQAIFYKVADGTDAATCTTTQSQTTSHIVYRISNFSGVPSIATSTGVSVNADPPSLNTGSSNKYLWIASGSWDEESLGIYMNVTSTPSGFGSFVSIGDGIGGGNGLFTAVSERFEEIQTKDPGAWASNVNAVGGSSNEWAVSTIAIAGATAAATTPPKRQSEFFFDE